MAKRETDVFRIKKCPICGKRFYADGDWVYKKMTYGTSYRYYCSWTCYRLPTKHGKKRKSRSAAETA